MKDLSGKVQVQPLNDYERRRAERHERYEEERRESEIGIRRMALIGLIAFLGIFIGATYFDTPALAFDGAGILLVPGILWALFELQNWAERASSAPTPPERP